MDREKLIKLAETLDDARKQANAQEATAHYVYRDIAEALKDVLALITDTDVAPQVYDDIIESGNTVREALVVTGQL